MLKLYKSALFFVMLSCTILSACSSQSATPTTTPLVLLSGTLRPYPSDTPSATPWPTDYQTPTPSPTVTPTATQVYHEVLEGDDFYSIGWRYHVSPQAIMTANPTVNPRAMSVGTRLLIPVTPRPDITATSPIQASPTATPQYKILHEPNCYTEALGGLWCFVLVENDEGGALENISARVTLTANGETRQEVAITPLNLLPPNESLPLIAYFQPPIPDKFTVSAQVDFLLPVMPADERYLQTEILRQVVELSHEDRIAQVSGEIRLLEDQPDTQHLWVNATAFNDSGDIVAVRRWESDQQLSAGESVPFQLSLFSMAGRIDQVYLLVEARASIESTGSE